MKIVTDLLPTFVFMNIEELHTLSRLETRSAYNWFEHSIDNPLFEVNDSYINQCIEHMKVDIGCGITNKFYKQLKSDAQWSFAMDVINKYKRSAVNKALEYVQLKRNNPQ